MNSQGYEDLADWLAVRLLIKEDVEEELKDPDMQQYLEMTKERRKF